MAHLRIDLPEGEILHHVLRPGRTSIGRSSSSDIVVSELSLSRTHAVIFSSGGRFYVEDAGSRNGTYVNQVRIKGPLGLSNGDLIKLGASRIHFSTDEEATHDHLPLHSEVITWTEARPASGEHLHLDTARYLIVQQLDLAREVQKFLLPRRAPDLSGYRIAGDMQPCFEVGGDFFDYQAMSDGRLLMVVADVARKGLGAALLGHYTQAYLRGAVGYEQQLEDLVGKINVDISAHTPPNQYVSATFCMLAPDTGEFEYINMGHCQPLLVHPGSRTEWLTHGNILLGILPDAIYTAGRARLLPGSMLILYSDGIIECEDQESSQFGDERLATFMSSRAELPPERIMSELEEEMERFTGGRSQGDDITLMIVQRAAG
jgi:serine phosphatase RsbU (regulator of sigma subunit)